MLKKSTFPNFLGGILLVCYKGYLSRTNPVEKASVAICSVKIHKMPVLEGQMLVDFATRMEMAVVNTYFKKSEEHRMTYKSGGRSTQVDYIICRRAYLKEIGDCQAIAGIM